jgi:hypothetical protein
MFFVFLLLVTKKTFPQIDVVRKNNHYLVYDAGAHFEQALLPHSKFVKSFFQKTFRSPRMSKFFLYPLQSTNEIFSISVEQLLSYPGLLTLGLFFSNYIIRPQALILFFRTEKNKLSLNQGQVNRMLHNFLRTRQFVISQQLQGVQILFKWLRKK